MSKKGGFIRSKKRITILAVAAVTAATSLGLFGVQTVTAISQRDISLVENLATRFNLSKNDIQAIFDEERQTREAEMETDINEQLRIKIQASKISY